MAVTSVDLIDEILVETVKSGYLQYDLTRVYQVLTNSRTDGPVTVLSSGSLPAIGSALVVGTNTVLCLSRKPKRQSIDKTAKKWIVNCQFTNNTDAFDRDEDGNPTTDPEDIVKEVTIEYEKISQPLNSATLESVTQGPYHDVERTITTPTWLPSHATAPTNTATDPLYIESSRTVKRISITKYYRTWPDFDDWLDSINDDELTITQTDDDGTRATFVFPAKTLRIDDVTKTDIWKNSKLYFKATFVMSHDPRTFIHSVIDEGQRQRVEVGSERADGTSWTLAQLNALDPPAGTIGFGLIPIEQDGYSVGQPAALNGHGQPLPYDEPGGTVDKGAVVYLNWKDDANAERDFDLLGL